MDNKRTAVALGLFDGVHLGHRAVLGAACAQKKQGLIPCAFTFPPESTAKKGTAGYIYSESEKRLLLCSDCGVERVVSPRFEDICGMDGDSFAGEILRGEMNAAFVCCGRDFRFGRGASCGTDGQWTGAITHQNYPLFFKENVLHKVYGAYPAQYQITQNTCRGVQKGAGKSLAIVNEVLYYKSRTGVCAYDGSLPADVSYVFGEDHFTGVDDTNLDFLRNGAVAGAHGSKYYINMKSDEDSKWYLFVYDTSAQTWHKEDEFRADCFCSCKNELYYIDHSTKYIRTMFGSGTADTDPVEWMAETGVLGTSVPYQNGATSLPGKKYIGQLLVRMSMEIGTRVDFYFQYDSDGVWRRVSSVTGRNLRSFYTVLRPRRCDHFRMRIVGVGEAKIFSISKNIEQGSDL